MEKEANEKGFWLLIASIALVFGRVYLLYINVADVFLVSLLKGVKYYTIKCFHQGTAELHTRFTSGTLVNNVGIRQRW